MRKELIDEIEIGEGVEVEISGDEIKLKKNNTEAIRRYEGFEIRKEGKHIILSCKKATKNQKKQMKTLKAHLVNTIMGMGEKFVYKLQICPVHFPMTVSVDKNKKEVMIKNFLGEVKPRIAKIIDGVEVKVEKEIITVSGESKEDTGQTAANIEIATRITNRDRRNFQDGIYLTEKPGEKM